MEKPAEQDPRVYFAAERTFLAWIRTGLGLMGVGFAVSRFGLFLRELSAGANHLPHYSVVGRYHRGDAVDGEVSQPPGRGIERH